MDRKGTPARRDNGGTGRSAMVLIVRQRAGNANVSTFARVCVTCGALFRLHPRAGTVRDGRERVCTRCFLDAMLVPCRLCGAMAEYRPGQPVLCPRCRGEGGAA